MKVEEYRERLLDLDGWQVNLTSYRIGSVFHCHADNVSPGANIARTHAPTREEAEQVALDRARQHLARTLRRDI